jgi:hypothetical protein
MLDLNGKLRRHDHFRYEVHRVGAGRSPVVVVDDFLSNADLLVEFAASSGAFVPSSESYPGLRAAVPPIYRFAMQHFLQPIIVEAFGVSDEKPVGGTCGYALVTTPPASLQTVQRIPHFDTTDPHHIAVVHYLCAPDKGGTSFYRHRQTGFDGIDAARLAAYTATIRRELAERGPSVGYSNGDDVMFQRIASFDAAFNRALVYRSNNLHSASIGTDFTFDPDPRTGRLTISAVLAYR